MEKIRNRYLITIAAMLVFTAIVNSLTFETYQKVDASIQTIENIPMNIDKWEGTDVFLNEQVYDILETKSIIHRNYSSNNTNVFLSLVYYPETKVDFHTPESCFGGQGLKVKKSLENIDIEADNQKVNIQLNRLIYERPGTEELVYYFYKAGEFIGNSYIGLRLNLAINTFTQKSKSGALIRVSTPIRNGDIGSSSEILTQFVEDLYPYLVNYL